MKIKEKTSGFWAGSLFSLEAFLRKANENGTNSRKTTKKRCFLQKNRFGFVTFF